MIIYAASHFFYLPFIRMGSTRKTSCTVFDSTSENVVVANICLFMPMNTVCANYQCDFY